MDNLTYAIHQEQSRQRDIEAIHRGACIILQEYMAQESMGQLPKSEPWSEYEKNAVWQSVKLFRLSMELMDAKEKTT